MKRLLDSRNRGSQSPPPPIIHTASLAPGDGHIHEPPPPRGVPRPPSALAPPSPPEAHGGPVSGKSILKPLHWNKVTRTVQGTLWKEFQRDGEGQSAPPEFDTAELEELFSDVAPKKVDSKEAEKKCPEKVHLIDPSRANSVEIMLTKVKMPLSNMTRAILAMAEGASRPPPPPPVPPPPPPTRGASTRFGAPWPLVGPPSPPPPPPPPPHPPTRPLFDPQPLFGKPLGDDPGRGHAEASRPPPPPPIPKVPPSPPAAWPQSINTFGGLLGGYPERGYEPGPPSELPRPPGRLGGGLGRGHRGGGPAVRNSNLNQLFPFKVTRAVKGSLWEEIQIIGEGQSSLPEFDHSEIETYFSNGPKKVVSKEAEKKKAVSSKPEQVQLIDIRRANNTLIMLTKVKMEYPQIVEAILTMNDKLLDANQLENILKFCPTKEEIEQLQNYHGDKNMLGKCEAYFLELMRVPRVESKVNCFLFKIQFNTQLEKFKKSLNTVNSACDEVRKSIKLRDVIKRISYLADTLSQGTDRGAEAGFNLDSLMKLVDTRSSISKMNLMHYLCKVFAAKAPALLDFPEDLVSLEAATKIQLKDLKEMHVIFHDGLQKAKHELDASTNDGPISQGFCMGLKEFISFVEAEVTIVTDLYTVARRKANGLAIYIGAGPAHCPFEQAIQTLHNFVRLYQKCREDNQDHEDDENKHKQAGQMTKPYNRLLM